MTFTDFLGCLSTRQKKIISLHESDFLQEKDQLIRISKY